ncbi:MAG: nitrogen regulation protein NR(I), partial [Methylotenera sp.]|nr:nitrogen regulation protein NR(I) [Methylotenera sp.]
NVRQLENVCHWLTVMAPGQHIDVSDLPPELKENTDKSANSISWQEALGNEVMNALLRGEQNMLETRTQEFERILISKALQHTGGRRIEAATQLGMGRNTISRKIQELGIEE